MAIKMIRRKEVVLEGVAFIEETYSDGEKEKIVRKQKSEPTADDEKYTLTETEQAILNTAINAEYLVCLAELGL